VRSAVPGKAGIVPIRDLQVQFFEVGRIRLGKKEPDKRFPDKHETFRITSRDQGLIEEAARLYGGQVKPWTPQGGGPPQFEVLTEADELPVYVPQQVVDPNYELWGKAVCKRRCDGVREMLSGDPCICKAQSIEPKSADHCKPTVRVQVMLADIPGLTVWRLESHGIYACAYLGQLAPLIANAPMPLPGKLILRKNEQRRWNATEKKVEVLQYIVPAIIIDALTARQVAIGGDAMTTALAAAGAPAAIGAAPARAIEQSSTSEPASSAPGLDKETLDRILVAVERADTVEALDKLRQGFIDHGVSDERVKAAWASKRAAVVAAAALALANTPQYAIGDQVEVGGITFTKVADSPFPEHNAPAQVSEGTTANPHPPAPAIPTQAEHQRAVGEFVTEVINERVKAPEPCTDVFCGGVNGGCGWSPDEHVAAHGGKKLLTDMPTGFTQPVSAPSERVIELPAADVTETVTTAQELHYDVDAERNALMAAAAHFNWTTAELFAKLKEHAGIATVGDATGAQLRAFRESLAAAR
jgi:hypothetical protein